MFNFFNKNTCPFYPEAWENGHFTVSEQNYFSEKKIKTKTY
jgi:hypothetical protein